MRIDDYIKELPDVYRKDKDSNNYKLLLLCQQGVEDFRVDIVDVDKTADVYTATGKTLELYGEMVGCPRGSATDEQYRYLIMQKVAENRVDGDYNSIVTALSVAFDVPVEEFVLQDTGNPAEVRVVNLPYSVLLNAGITAAQAVEIIKKMLPSGVTLEPVNLEGTFEFGSPDDYDENKGFGNAAQTIGGYLGYLAS